MNLEEPYKLVLVRHGESLWNRENRFTGWVDVDLSDNGIKEAKLAGFRLREGGFNFDIAYTSVLKRAIKTLWHILDETDHVWVPVIRSWRLNERMYGALQGLNKNDVVEKHGEDQVKIWRRSYDLPPPPVDDSAISCIRDDKRYADLADTEIPRTESLKDTVERILPLWYQKISQDVKSRKKVLIVAHGNSLRAIVKHLENLSDKEVVELNIPTAIPLVYELDENLKHIRHYYLADEETVRKAEALIASQSQKKR